MVTRKLIKKLQAQNFICKSPSLRRLLIVGYTTTKRNFKSCVLSGIHALTTKRGIIVSLFFLFQGYGNSIGAKRIFKWCPGVHALATKSNHYFSLFSVQG